MAKRLLTSCLIVAALASGCAGGGSTTVLTIKGEDGRTWDRQQQSLRRSATRMYHMILNQDARGFCGFVAPASIKGLAARFPRSKMSSTQICQTVSKAAFHRYAQDVAGRRAIKSSITQLAGVQFDINGNRASMGSGAHHTGFVKVGHVWRPEMPSIGGLDGSEQAQQGLVTV